MTDLELTKACAVAMAKELPALVEHEGELRFGYGGCMGPAYEPLTNDAQAMALVKRFRLDIVNYFALETENNKWRVVGTCSGWDEVDDRDLNRAIVRCAAQFAKLAG